MITGEVPTQQYDDDGVLGNLPDPTTVNRREVMGGLSALGVTAAAPSVMKIVDDIPLPVKAAVESPTTFRACSFIKKWLPKLSL